MTDIDTGLNVWQMTTYHLRARSSPPSRGSMREKSWRR